MIFVFIKIQQTGTVNVKVNSRYGTVVYCKMLKYKMSPRFKSELLFLLNWACCVLSLTVDHDFRSQMGVLIGMAAT